MFDVRVTYKDQAGEIQEETSRLRGKDGSAVGIRDLVIFCYRLYAKRSIQVQRLDVLQYVPKPLSVAIDDDGGLTIDGEPFDLETAMRQLADDHQPAIVMRPGAQFPTAAIQQQPAANVQRIMAPAEGAVQTAAVGSPQPAPSAPPPPPAPTGDVRLHIPRNKLPDDDRCRLDYDQEVYEPSHADRSRGAARISVFSSGRRMIYRPPFRTANARGLPPIPPDTLIAVQELWLMHNGRRMWRVAWSGNEFFLPEEMMDVAPDNLPPDPNLVLQSTKPDDRPVVGDASGRAINEEATSTVPLQMGSGGSSAGGGSLQGVPVQENFEIPELVKSGHSR